MLLSDHFTLATVVLVALALLLLAAVFALGVANDVKSSQRRRRRREGYRASDARRRALSWLTRRPGVQRLTDQRSHDG